MSLMNQCQALDSINTLKETVAIQNRMITGLQEQVRKQEADLDILKNPSYERLYAYTDNQIIHVMQETDRKLALKPDHRDIELSVPARLDDAYRQLQTNVQEIKYDMLNKATKEDLKVLASNKVDHSEFRDALAQVHDKASVYQVQREINQVVSPLTKSMAALEKTLQLQASHATTTPVVSAASQSSSAWPPASDRKLSDLQELRVTECGENRVGAVSTERKGL